MPGGNTRTTVYVDPHPPYAVAGEGARIVDADGHAVVDLLCNYTALVHGNAHPALVRAAADAIASGTSFGLPTEHELALSTELCRRVASVERLRFANSGSEAVMMAIRGARAFTGRDRVLRVAGAYHGLYDDVLAEDAVGMPAHVRANVVTVPHNDAGALRRALEQHGPKLACAIVDLMPNRAGLVPADREFVQVAREGTLASGALLIVDEVITLRLATGGLQSLYGVTPDLTVMGKLIGGGFSIGAFGGRAEVMDVFVPLRPETLLHGGTFTASPVAMRAGLAAVELLDAAAIDRIDSLGARLREELAALDFEVTGRGSLLRLHDLARDPALWWELYRAGVLVAPNGLASVPTVLTDDDLEAVVGACATARARSPRC